eukprot:COSAG06_NODE_28126_length_580_cov_0.941788_1_plen_33_part_01
MRCEDDDGRSEGTTQQAHSSQQRDASGEEAKTV